MKIAIICPEMLPVPAIKGGSIETAIDGITPYLSKNHDLTIISIADPALPARQIIKGVEYLRFPPRSYRFSVASYLSKNRNFDIIDVCNRPRNVYLYKKASPQSRFVTSLHNPMFGPGVMPEKEGLRCIEQVEKIVTVSSYLAGTVYRRFPAVKPKLKTVYFGVDTNKFRPVWAARGLRQELRKKYRLKNRQVIIFTGRVIPKKGPHLLVDALKLLLPRYPDTVLVIVGTPWYSDATPTPYLRRLHAASRPVKDKIIFTGYVPQNQMPGHYVMGDIFVCPSQCQDSAARTHYEAMACGLPVVTTRRGGSPEIVTHQHDGIVVRDYSNPAALARAIGYLLANPDKARKFAKKGRAAAENRFTFARTALELEKVYLDAAITSRAATEGLLPGAPVFLQASP